MLLMIDNYDSFTYNLVQYFGELGERVLTVRNDAIDVAGIEALAPARIVISPGPCTPTEAGVSLAVIARFAGRLPILGVCLGHQAIGLAFGARVEPNMAPRHGRASAIEHGGADLFAGISSPMEAARYHSLVVCEPLPAPLIVGFGPVLAVDFVGNQNGADLFAVIFANAATEWVIGFNEAGKVAALLFRPAA
jgi:anthranilate synthase component 2